MVVYKINCNNNSYGIDAYDDNNILLINIEQITCLKTDMENIINMCNELEIEPSHLDYIIEDYLTDFSI